jgi:alcohol dehydrogenase (NADP+)
MLSIPRAFPAKSFIPERHFRVSDWGRSVLTKLPPQTVADAVYDAACVSYRHFDCASVYGNERLIGYSFQQILRGGIARDELWVTSKLWNDKHGEDDVIASCIHSLRDLQLDYLDLYLIHWPFPNFHAPGCDVHSRNPNAKPYIHENYMKTWRQLEKLVMMGLVRHIGASNMIIPKLGRLMGSPWPDHAGLIDRAQRTNSFRSYYR